MLYHDGRDGERQCTIITSEFGRLKGLRIVRGRDDECEAHYRKFGELSGRQLQFSGYIPEAPAEIYVRAKPKGG